MKVIPYSKQFGEFFNIQYSGKTKIHNFINIKYGFFSKPNIKKLISLIAWCNFSFYGLIMLLFVKVYCHIVEGYHSVLQMKCSTIV